MKKTIIVLGILGFGMAYAQSNPAAQKVDRDFKLRVGINTNSPQASVDIVELLNGGNPIEGKLQGLSLPNFTTEQRNKFGAGQTASMKIGTLIYNTTEKCVEMYQGYYNGAHQWSCTLSAKNTTPNAQKKDTNFSKRVGLNTKEPQASVDIVELLEGGNPIDGRLQGLSLPNFTTEQRDKMGAGQTESMKIGALIYNTTEKCIQKYLGYYNGAHQWSCNLSDKGATPNAQKEDTSFAKRVGINTKAPQASMDIVELNPIDGRLQGLSLPNFTTEQRNKFGAGQTESMKIGTLIYNTTEKCIEMYKGYYNGAHQWGCNLTGKEIFELPTRCNVVDYGHGQRIAWAILDDGTEKELFRKTTPLSKKDIEESIISLGIDPDKIVRVRYVSSEYRDVYVGGEPDYINGFIGSYNDRWRVESRWTLEQMRECNNWINSHYEYTSRNGRVSNGCAIVYKQGYYEKRYIERTNTCELKYVSSGSSM